MTDNEYEEFRARKKELGRQIETATAEVIWCYAQVLDPYGVGRVPEGGYCVGREYFARAPGSDEWISFDDLPEATVTAMENRPEPAKLGVYDVGGWVQVRSTVLTNGRLIVKPKDKDAHPFVLVRQNGRRHRLLGWMMGYEAKRITPLDSSHGHPAHYVEQRFLRPIADLKQLLHARPFRLS